MLHARAAWCVRAAGAFGAGRRRAPPRPAHGTGPHTPPARPRASSEPLRKRSTWGLTSQLSYWRAVFALSPVRPRGTSSFQTMAVETCHQWTLSGSGPGGAMLTTCEAGQPPAGAHLREGSPKHQYSHRRAQRPNLFAVPFWRSPGPQNQGRAVQRLPRLSLHPVFLHLL